MSAKTNNKTTNAKAETAHAYNITILGKHVQVTDAMKAYTRTKLAKLDRISQRILDIHVTMDIQRGEHRIDAVIWVENVKIKVSASTNDMYASTDLLIDRLAHKLRRYLTRLHEHHGRGIKAVDMNVKILRRRAPEISLEEINDEIDSENLRRSEEAYRPHEIVNQETRPLKLLRYDEAVMKMDLSDDYFLIFRCEEDQKLKVIYRRDDGDYGVIEPE
jgi:putative sigma-54 modulation protein